MTLEEQLDLFLEFYDDKNLMTDFFHYCPPKTRKVKSLYEPEVYYYHHSCGMLARPIVLHRNEVWSYFKENDII